VQFEPVSLRFRNASWSTDSCIGRIRRTSLTNFASRPRLRRGAENAGVENAGVENAGVDSKGIAKDELST